MKLINLLPQSELRELKLELASKQLLKFFMIIAASLIVAFVLILTAKVVIKSNIDASETQIASLQDQIKSSNNQELEKQVVDLNSEIKNLKTLDQQHQYWSKAFLELANLSPSGFALDVVTADRATGLITISGTSGSRDDVLLFWSNVKKSSYFKNINFPLTNLEKATNTPFSFNFYINPDSINTP